MKHLVLLICASAFFPTAAKAQENQGYAEWVKNYYDGKAPLLTGYYRIYGGELGDVKQPTIGDAKISIAIAGRAAADIFSKLGKDSRNVIYSEPGERIRQKGDIYCRKSLKGKYFCNIGMDLKSGKSIPATDC